MGIVKSSDEYLNLQNFWKVGILRSKWLKTEVLWILGIGLEALKTDGSEVLWKSLEWIWFLIRFQNYNNIQSGARTYFCIVSDGYWRNSQPLWWTPGGFYHWNDRYFTVLYLVMDNDVTMVISLRHANVTRHRIFGRLPMRELKKQLNVRRTWLRSFLPLGLQSNIMFSWFSMPHNACNIF